jgi:hypothetical protein
LYPVHADAELGFDRRYHAHASIPDARFEGRAMRVTVAASSYQESIHRAIEALMRRQRN